MPRLGGSDQDLIVRVGLGDLDCLGELFLRYHQPILNFAHRMIGDSNAADSITQDVFVRVLRHADKFDAAQAVRPWLYTIAANLCRDYLSKQGRRNTVEMAVEPPAPLDGPLEQLATSEECGRVKKAVQELPEIYREIVVMRIYEQLPYAEIAAALDIREGTARSRMEYALNRLRKALAPKEGFGRERESKTEPPNLKSGRAEKPSPTNVEST
jgi:RNA polymerase sigma-70 factor, ECF subfamily